MKNKLFLLLALLFIAGYLQAQWEVQLDNQNFCHLGRIHFIDEDYGWAIGGNEFVSPYFYTTDGGENWYLCDDWMNRMGADIVFVNPDTGFIAAPNGIIRKTVNGGQAWTDIQTPATQDVMRLFFVDENNGWATLGSYSDGHILKTENTGDSWEILYPAIDGTQSIYFLDANIGWFVSWIGPPFAYGVILKTNNGGYNFITQYTCSSHTYFEDIYFYSEQIGWAVGQKSSINTYFIIKTEDGGESWEEQILPDLVYFNGATVGEASIIYSIQFANDTLGWLTCADEYYNSGYVLLTTDGGETWQQQFVNYNFNKPIYDICMVDNNTGWAVGADYIYHTDNGDTIIIVGVDENISKKDLIKINPNPFTDYVHLQISDEYHFVDISISDINGKICFRKNENINNYIDLTFLKKGVYFLSIQFSSNNQIHSLTKKIIKL